MDKRNGLTWRKSSKSGGGACVEVAVDGTQVRMRDSKDAAGPVLSFDRETFRDFLTGVKATGNLDR